VRTLVAIDPRMRKRDTGACVKPEVVTMVNERPWVLVGYRLCGVKPEIQDTSTGGMRPSSIDIPISVFGRYSEC
jgi:hypothetical protein